MKKIEKVIALVVGRIPSKAGFDDELAQKVLAYLFSASSKDFPEAIRQVFYAIQEKSRSVSGEQIAGIFQALFMMLPPGSTKTEVFALYCEIVRTLAQQSHHHLTQGAILGSMCGVAWLHDNKEWNADEYAVAYMGFLNDVFKTCPTPVPKFSSELAGTLSNISTSFVSACAKGMPQYFAELSTVDWGERSFRSQSPLAHQLITEISQRLLLSMPTPGKVRALNTELNR